MICGSRTEMPHPIMKGMMAAVCERRKTHPGPHRFTFKWPLTWHGHGCCFEGNISNEGALSD